MTIQQIEMFLSLAEHLNFTKTAKEYFTTQPTVSRQIGLLEEEFGFPLFVRSKKEVRLTYQGAIMVKKCREALETIQSGVREVTDIVQQSGYGAENWLSGRYGSGYVCIAYCVIF